jgi:hypothetical protein
MIEMTLAFVGFAVFIYVFLNVWVWMNGMIVQRQEAFQATRLSAGQEATAGAPVGYQRPPIELIGQPGAVGGDRPPVELPPPIADVPVGEAPCQAAVPFYEQARTLLAEAAALQAEGANRLDQAHQWSEALRAQLAFCATHRSSFSRNRCRRRAINNYTPSIRWGIETGVPMLEQARAKTDEAMGLIRQGDELCD